jgi:hypothetical protein
MLHVYAVLEGAGEAAFEGRRSYGRSALLLITARCWIRQSRVD